MPELLDSPNKKSGSHGHFENILNVLLIGNERLALTKVK